MVSAIHTSESALTRYVMFLAGGCSDFALRLRKLWPEGPPR